MIGTLLTSRQRVRSTRICGPVLLSILLASVNGCIDPGDPGTLVPPTVDEDLDLPGMGVVVDGVERRIHLREFGDPSSPVLFILPGSASDIRAYLPLQLLADDYRVVMWDLPGNGLSERVPPEELEFHRVAESIEAVRQQISPDRPITILGHSWSATIAALYLGAYPDAVFQAVLIESPGLKDEFQEQVGLALDLAAPGYLEMVWNTEYMPTDHEGLDYQMLAMSRSKIRHFFCPGKPNPEWPVWRPGALALIVWERSVLSGTSFSYDFTPGLDRFTGEVLIVGTECSPLGTEFQEKTNLTVFQNATMLHIPDSNHRILTEQFDALVTGLRDFLDPVGAATAGGGS